MGADRRQIKLVIWDLDETFWSGVLGEGTVRYDQANHDLVVELTNRGVMNSICSKNDFEKVKAFIESTGLWSYFVFPKIAWSPKGELIAKILEEMQLRAENVLFVDDNHQNLQEALFYSPNLQLAGPDQIAAMRTWPALAGKDDRSHSRLKQYKVLEAKAVDQRALASNNDEFLRRSEIKVRIERDCAGELERAHELIARTNQLNYTKNRCSLDELRALVARPGVQSGCVFVSDRYGDYGNCGFFAVENGVMVHYTLSCRIMNMGVEHWVYHAKLGQPKLTVVGEVVTPLDPNFAPDWIEEITSAPAATPSVGDAKTRADLRILLKGGCDLEQIKGYLGQDSVFDTEFNFMSPTGMPVHREHTEILLRSNQPQVIAQYGAILDRLPFMTRGAFDSMMLAGEHDVYIYSLLMDYTQGLYRHRGSDFVIPYGDLSQDITDEDTWREVLADWERFGLNRAVLADFKERFEFLGGLSPEQFLQNLREIARRIPQDRLLLLMNGAEISTGYRFESGRLARHREMNAIVDRVVAETPNVKLIDIRHYVTLVDDLTDSVRHYRRRKYFDLAGAIHAAVLAGTAADRGVAYRAYRFARTYARSVAGTLVRRVMAIGTRKAWGQ